MPEATVRSTDGWSAVTDRELRRCTVKIDVAGAPKGTGFFVAPGHVVTCAHVLESLDIDAPGAGAAIAVRDLEDCPFAVSSVPDFFPDDDLAVLRVEPSDAHPCVLVIPGLRMHDHLETFGYPELRREGLGRALRSEGTTGNERLHALAGGQVQPGMSGAPVLNKRTGGVCGVLQLTRNEALDIGGYAIPVEQLAQRSPKLLTDSDRYHEAYRGWFDLLPADERAAWQNTRGGTSAAGRRKCTFVVTVERTNGDWEVTAERYPGDRVGPERVDLNMVRDKVARLFRYWASRGRADPYRIAPGRLNPGEEVRLLGQILFTAVLPRAVGSAFEAELPGDEQWVELALHFGSNIEPELVELPWEHLYLTRRGVMTLDVQIAADDKVGFVRVLEPTPSDPEEAHRRQLSTLMVGVSPPVQVGVSPTDLVLQNAESMATTLGVQLEPLPMPTAMQLGAKVAQGSYDIVHYVGFGRYAVGADQLALGGTGRYEFEDAQRFAMRLAGRRPRVVVLQQVEHPDVQPAGLSPMSAADAATVPADLSVFAWNLLHQGVEAVIAYQFPVSDRVSIAFNQTLYEKLAAGVSVEHAAQQARAVMSLASDEPHAFLSPATFVRRPGELKLTAPARESTPLPRVGVHAGHA